MIEVAKAQHDDALVRESAQWLLLVHQLPPNPAYLRVKIWRRLQGLGAVALKNSVYVLPGGNRTREDFQWLLGEIKHGGGDGMICDARLVDGFDDRQLRGLFNAARDTDYAKIADELRDLAPQSKRGTSAPKQRSATEIDAKVRRLRHRLGEISLIDFFGATGRLTAEALLSDLDARISGASSGQTESPDAAKMALSDLTGKTWVTRRDIGIDRIACGWLIRRFIDSNAQFKFVIVDDYGPGGDELRFDMFNAEFTHEGDKCSFEVMLARTGMNDAALNAIAEIVHDIDLKDEKFGREQASGIGHVLAGICARNQDDTLRLERGGELLDDTYEYFKRIRGR